MIKSGLVKQISEANPHLYQEDVEKMLNAILEEITGAMSRGERVEIRGLDVTFERAGCPDHDRSAVADVEIQPFLGALGVRTNQHVDSAMDI